MCSVVGLKHQGRAFLGANYDYRFGHGLMYLCTRDIQKWTEDDRKQRHEWVSRYGSVTFVQFGCELPNSGMNEAGLSIHLMEQRDGDYGEMRKESKKLNELQWIQYHLDLCATVQEVAQSAKVIQIEKAINSLHYIVADASGNIAIIEYVKGETVVHPLPENDRLFLTNHSLQASDKYYNTKTQKNQLPPCDAGSLNRYFWLKQMFSKISHIDDPKSTLTETLNEVSIRPSKKQRWISKLLRRAVFQTHWRSLFIPHQKTVEFQVNLGASKQTISLDQLDFSPQAGRKILNFSELSGQTSPPNFKQYNKSENAAVVKTTYKPFRLFIPKKIIEFIIAYPDSFTIATKP